MDKEYTDTDYLALGHFLRREMYGVELNEEESCMATMSVLKFDFNRIEIPEVEDKIQQIEIEERWGIISEDGWIAFPIYDWIDGFKEGFARLSKEHKLGYINRKGEIAGKGIIYDKIDNFKNSISRVYIYTRPQQSGGGSFINNLAYLILQLTTAKVGIITKEGMENEKGCCYNKINNFKGGFAVVKKYDNKYIKYGFINTKGEEVFGGLIYDVAFSFKRQFARIRFNGRKGFIDKQGNFYDKRPN
jgi:hypothetical protein